MNGSCISSFNGAPLIYEQNRICADSKPDEKYDARFSELLATLPADAVSGLAEVCVNIIRAWCSNGGSCKVERSIIDVAITDYPRVLAINICRALHETGMDKTEAHCLIVSIFEDAMEEMGVMWAPDVA